MELEWAPRATSTGLMSALLKAFDSSFASFPFVLVWVLNISFIYISSNNKCVAAVLDWEGGEVARNKTMIAECVFCLSKSRFETEH